MILGWVQPMGDWFGRSVGASSCARCGNAAKPPPGRIRLLINWTSEKNMKLINRLYYS
jgi:hypothetical protein